MPTATVRLPAPHYASVRDDTEVVIGGDAGRVPFGHVPDPQLHPRTFMVTWESVTGPTADAIRRAYAANPYDVFDVVIPYVGTVLVIWNTPPNIQWSSWSRATITAELEEAIAHT
jgi:hypothetical protein